MAIAPIQDRLRQLGLTAMAAEWTSQQTQPDVTALPFEERFGLLVEAEWAARDQRGIQRRLHAAHLRVTATPEDLDWQTPRGLPRPTVQQLWRRQGVADHQTVLVTGPTGVGKTYLLCALGHAACRRRYHVTDLRVPRLLGEAAVAKTTGQWLPWLQRLRRWDLLLLDDWGLSPFTVEESHDLFEVLDDRYQGRATAIAGQVPVTQWPSLFPDATVGEAILDRLVHQAIRLPLTGESMRKVLATAGQSGTTDPTPTG